MESARGSLSNATSADGDGPWERFSMDFPTIAWVIERLYMVPVRDWDIGDKCVLLGLLVLILWRCYLKMQKAHHQETQARIERRRAGFWLVMCRSVTVTRICFATICVSYLVFLYGHGNLDDFTVASKYSTQLSNEDACFRRCMATHTDRAARLYFDGRGVCESRNASGDVVRAIKFEVCEKTRAPGPQCQRATEWVPRGHSFSRCSFRVLVERWKPDFVIFILCMAIVALVEGAAADQVMIGSATTFVLLGIIDMETACSGFNAEILPVVTFFPIMKALAETGMIEKSLLPLLGRPTHLRAAIARLYALSACLSIFIGNTPLILMLLPLVTKWCRVAGLPENKIFMPMANAVLTGSCMSEIGSISGIMAQALSKQRVDMAVFDTLSTGLVTCILPGLLCIGLAPTFMLRSGMAVEKGACDSPESWIELCERGHQKPGEYTVVFRVVKGGALDGKPVPPQIGEVRDIPGIAHVQVQGNDNGPCVDDGGALTRAFLGNDHMAVTGTPASLARVRTFDGLQLLNHEDFTVLGSRRRGRQLYEATLAVSIGEGEEGCPLESLDADELRNRMGIALFASRRPNGAPPWAPESGGQRSVRAGDVLLFEAHHDDLQLHADLYTEVFSIVKPIPNSSPPRREEDFDDQKHRMAFATFVLMLILVSSGVCDLGLGSTTLVAFYTTTRVLTFKDALESINVNVILFMGAGVGVATAVHATGIDHAISDATSWLATAYGFFGQTASVYTITLGLGCFLGQPAIVPMVMPLLTSMVDDSSLSPEQQRALLHVLVFASTCVFVSPLGSIPQFLIMGPGRHTYLDFFVFGLLPQLVHAFASIFLVPLMLC